MKIIRSLAIFIAVLTIIIQATVCSVSAADSNQYTSTKIKFPKKFGTDIFDSVGYLLYCMDSVYFDGKQFVFFTIFNDGGGWDSDEYLYYFCPNNNFWSNIPFDESHQVFKFKLCVFNNKLYFFYTADDNGNGSDVHARNAIYYLVAEPGLDDKGNYDLCWSEEYQITPGGSTLSICVPAVMNGELYLLYTDEYGPNYDWYYTKSSDGTTFSDGVRIKTDFPPQIKTGTVFQIPNADNGCVDRMMLGYISPPLDNYECGHINFTFFDGENCYGTQYPDPVTLTANTVRIISGTADGCTSDRAAIQVWVGQYYKSFGNYQIYHAEYIPAGVNGDEGTWPVSDNGPWLLLDKSSDDKIVSDSNDSTVDYDWSVIPYYTKENNNTRTYLNIWYYRGNNFYWPDSKTVWFRCTSYKSDLLSYQGRTTVDAAQQDDLNMCPLVGVIQGTPVFSTNGADPIDYSGFSTVTVGQQTIHSVDTSIEWGVSVVASYGAKFLDGLFSAGLSVGYGLKANNSTANTVTVSTSKTFDSTAETTPGDLGWALFFKPEIFNDTYLMHTYAGTPMTYAGTAVNFELSLISVGNKSFMDTYSLFLQHPETGYSYSDIFKGMAAAPLSTDYNSWYDFLPDDSSDYYKKTKFATLAITQGESADSKEVSTDTHGSTYSPNLTMSVKAGALGFTVTDTVSFTTSFKSVSSFQDSVEFTDRIPPAQTNGDLVHIDVTPCLLTPNSDDSGYQCSWITDDIKTYNKAKPWCITYNVSGIVEQSDDSSAMTIKKIKANCKLNHAEENEDQLSINLQVEVPSSFTLDAESLYEIRFGNHLINSIMFDADLTRTNKQNTCIKFYTAKGEVPKRSLVIKHNKRNSILTVTVKSDHTDLTNLAAYGLTNKDTDRGELLPMPVGLVMQGKYHAVTEVALLYKSVLNKRASANGSDQPTGD